MERPVIMGVVAEGATFPVGTPVWGTDYNAAYSLFLRWLGLLEAPAHVDVTPFWQDFVDAEFSVAAPDLQVDDARSAVAMLDAFRASGARSYQIGFDDLYLNWIAENLFQLDATFIEQHREPDGGTTTRRCSCRAVLHKRPDGRLVFRRIDGAIESQQGEATFVAQYAVNRAKATMVQFQTHADLLTGDAAPMRELLMPALELNGLVNSKADETKAGSETFTDVRNLRESISKSERRQDNVIRTHVEFSEWFASCSGLFKKNGFHKLEKFVVTPLADDRYEVVAQFHWQAETINGAKIELHHPLTWILAETGDKYMRIEKLLPFG